mmetsp:Transcript_31809/g.92985  ORF Transcript_31809/g.92985 Transcript_31809/m.92985 type:complete len:494 (+) Transcript_31809:125-1606(+)
MGHSKKKKKQPAAKGHGGVARASAGHGEQDSDEENAGSPEWLAEQRRMLEMYSTQACAAEEEAKSAVIEKQRKLLEEAAGDKSSSAADALAGGEPAPTVSAGGASSSLGAVAGGRRDVKAHEEVFQVRRVRFCGRQVPVLLQHRNGPCPLLAVANGLLLRGTLTLEDDEAVVDSRALIDRLSALCTTLNERARHEDANVREEIAEVVRRLPSLIDGLILNCGFRHCKDFEFTPELGLFDCVGVQLFHVWVEPEVAAVAAGWNQLSEQLATCSEIRSRLEKDGGEPTEDEDELLAKGLWLEQWLEEHRAQSTPRGLVELLDTTKVGEICVLFRNNHFSTLYKPAPKALCALLTDEAFAEEASAVWESVELDGSTGCILGPDFEPASAAPLGTGGSKSSGAGKAPSAEKRQELLDLVAGMGFDLSLAEAGLVAVGWTSAQEAVEAILEADGGLPKPRVQAAASIAGFSEDHKCPSCGKVFRSKNGALNHRAQKGH